MFFSYSPTLRYAPCGAIVFNPFRVIVIFLSVDAKHVARFMMSIIFLSLILYFFYHRNLSVVFNQTEAEKIIPARGIFPQQLLCMKLLTVTV